MTDYEIEYQNHKSVCGEPFTEIENFFSNSDKFQLTVLDLGCGQGRDALMAAKYGHSVLGVDLSPTGIKQMTENAAVQGLEVVGKVADIRNFRSSNKFNVVILDRVIHMFAPLNDKIHLLGIAASYTQRGGHILIVDTPKNLPVIDEFFESSREWEATFQKKGFRFYRKLKIT